MIWLILKQENLRIVGELNLLNEWRRHQKQITLETDTRSDVRTVGGSKMTSPVVTIQMMNFFVNRMYKRHNCRFLWNEMSWYDIEFSFWFFEFTQ